MKASGEHRGRTYAAKELNRKHRDIPLLSGKCARPHRHEGWKKRKYSAQFVYLGAADVVNKRRLTCGHSNTFKIRREMKHLNMYCIWIVLCTHARAIAKAFSVSLMGTLYSLFRLYF